MESEVLKICDEEPGTSEQIAMLAGLEEAEALRILSILEEKGLVYEDKGIWATTIKGAKKLKN